LRSADWNERGDAVDCGKKKEPLMSRSAIQKQVLYYEIILNQTK